MPQTESYIKKNITILNRNDKAIVHAAGWGMDDDNLKVFAEEIKLKTSDHSERKHTSSSSFVKDRKRNSLASEPLLDPQTMFGDDQSVHDASIKKLHINLSGNLFTSKGLQFFLENFLTNTSLTVSLDLSNKSIDILDRSVSEKLFNVLQSPMLSELRLDNNVVQELQRIYGGIEDVSPLTKIMCVMKTPTSAGHSSSDPLNFTSPKLDKKYEEKKEFNGIPKAQSSDDAKFANLKSSKSNPREAIENFAKELHALGIFLGQEMRLEQDEIGRLVRRLFIFEDVIQIVLFYWTKFEELDDTFHRRALNNKEEGAYMDVYLCLHGISIYSQVKMNSRLYHRSLHLEMNHRANQLMGYCSQFIPKSKLSNTVLNSHIQFEKFLHDEAERIKSRLMAAQKKQRDQRAYSFVMETAVSELAKEKDSKGMLEKYINISADLQVKLENRNEKHQEELQAKDEKSKKKTAEDRKNYLYKIGKMQREHTKETEGMRQEIEALERAQHEHAQELTEREREFDKKLKAQQLESTELKMRVMKMKENINVQLEQQKNEIMHMLDPKYLRPEYQQQQTKLTTPTPPNDPMQSEFSRSASWAGFYSPPSRRIPATRLPNTQTLLNDVVLTTTTQKTNQASTTLMGVGNSVNFKE